jgi:hypothetical protein
MRTAANLTSTLLTHHITVKLEMILDKEADIAHDMFAAQIEARLGSGEGDNAKGPDMKVWNRGRNLNDVCFPTAVFSSLTIDIGRLAADRVLLSSYYPITINQYWI